MFGGTWKYAFEIFYRLSALLQALTHVWTGSSILQLSRKSGRIDLCGGQARLVLRWAFRNFHAVCFYTSLLEERQVTLKLSLHVRSERKLLRNRRDRA